LRDAEESDEEEYKGGSSGTVRFQGTDIPLANVPETLQQLLDLNREKDETIAELKEQLEEKDQQMRAVASDYERRMSQLMQDNESYMRKLDDMRAKYD